MIRLYGADLRTSFKDRKEAIGASNFLMEKVRVKRFTKYNCESRKSNKSVAIQLSDAMVPIFVET